MIRAFASEPQYRAHIEPVAKLLGVTWERKGDGPVIVASYKDYRQTTGDVIYMEHGTGQTYSVPHNSYGNGKDRKRVKLFLCPSERVAEMNRRAFPHIPAEVVGCPKMDRFHRGIWITEYETVGLAFHWNAHVCPESRSAFSWYVNTLPALARRFDVIGTCHPRAEKQVLPFYRRAGIRVVSFETICERASVLVCDNSSVGWEFLSLDRPVVWLNAPWYRKDVEHGLRFWEFADSGLQVDRPEELGDAIVETQATDPRRARRREVIPQVYAVSGHAAELAAAAIVRWKENHV